MPRPRARVQEQVRQAMRARDKQRLTALRTLDAAILKYEVDKRQEISEEDFMLLLNQLRKQRNEAMEQYKNANRNDLYEQELFEKNIIEEFLPEQLSNTEIEELVSAAIDESGAQEIKQMGMVMARLKTTLMGRANMAEVSSLVRQKLSSK